MKNKFYKIIKLLVKDENITYKIIKLINSFHKKYNNEELKLCLVKVLIIFIYNNNENSLIFIDVMNYFLKELNSDIRKKILKVFENMNLSKQFLISDYIMDRIVKLNFFLLSDCSNKSFELWYDLLCCISKIRIKTVEVKSSLYNIMLNEIINNKDSSKELFKNVFLIENYIYNNLNS
jgi:hypothetical protein